MTASEPEEPQAETSGDQERRRRAEQLLGGLLPDQTSDETAEGWGGGTESESRDDELRRDVPPHHGE